MTIFETTLHKETQSKGKDVKKKTKSPSTISNLFVAQG